MEPPESGAEPPAQPQAPVSRVPPRLIAVIVLACIAGIIAGLVISAPRHSVKLPDGSILKLEGVTYGTNQLVVGRLLERTIYKLTHYRLSSKILGVQFWRPIVADGDPDRVNFHFTQVKPKSGGSEATGNLKGVILNGTLIEIIADTGERLKVFGLMGTGIGYAGYSRLSFVLPSQPAKPAKLFRVRLSRRDASGQFVQLAEFTVRNPAPSGKR